MGREEWNAWREANVLTFALIVIGSIVVITLPTLWFVGRRLAQTLTPQEKEVAAARGVGRFAVQALKGSVPATDKLFDLVNDPVLPVRCQAGRALALLDKREVDKELLRQVRYWEANDKVALIRTLRSTQDVRVHRVVEMLSRDRNPIVAKRAREALTVVTPQTRRMDKVAASVKATRPAGEESVGMSKQSVGVRRVAAARPSAAPSDDTAPGGSSVRRRERGALPSMAPGDRAARAAAREGAARGKAARRAAEAADDQVPMRKRSADIAPKPAAARPRPAGTKRPAGAPKPAGTPRPAGAPRPADTAKSAAGARPAGKPRPAGAPKPAGTTKSSSGAKPAGTGRPPGSPRPAKRRPADAGMRPAGPAPGATAPSAEATPDPGGSAEES